MNLRWVSRNQTGLGNAEIFSLASSCFATPCGARLLSTSGLFLVSGNPLCSRLVGLLCLLSLAVASTPTFAADDTLGRLIFTPEERAEMDLSRSGKGAVTQIIRSPELTVNGVVFRPGSPTTAWVDGEAVAEADLPAGVRLMRDEQGKLLGLESGTGRGAGIKRPFGEAFPRPYATRPEAVAQ
ncbi:MAG: hypothetical protein RLZZ298_1288 [Pseudomonadota bacterium]